MDRESSSTSGHSGIDTGVTPHSSAMCCSEWPWCVRPMIGRRGRFITIAMALFYFLYADITARQSGNFASAFTSQTLLDQVIVNWLFIALYRADGFLGAVFYGAQSYDGILLIDSAVKAVKGDVKDTKGMVTAMRKANINSLRGPFTYNTNHHPIQNFYLLRAEKVADGIEMRIQRTVFEKHKDAYYEQCKMKW